MRNFLSSNHYLSWPNTSHYADFGLMNPRSPALSLVDIPLQFLVGEYMHTDEGSLGVDSITLPSVASLIIPPRDHRQFRLFLVRKILLICFKHTVEIAARKIKGTNLNRPQLTKSIIDTFKQRICVALSDNSYVPI